MSSGLPAIYRSGSGGQGGALSPADDLPDVSRSDVRDMGRAITGRWPMSTAERRDVVETLHTVASHPGAFGVREAVQAARALIQADRLNQHDEQQAAKVEPTLIEIEGRVIPDFSGMTGEELERYIHGR